MASAQTPRYVRRTLSQQTVDVLEPNPRPRTIHAATQIRACWCPGGTADFRGAPRKWFGNVLVSHHLCGRGSRGSWFRGQAFRRDRIRRRRCRSMTPDGRTARFSGATSIKWCSTRSIHERISRTIHMVDEGYKFPGHCDDSSHVPYLVPTDDRSTIPCPHGNGSTRALSSRVQHYRAFARTPSRSTTAATVIRRVRRARPG